MNSPVVGDSMATQYDTTLKPCMDRYTYGCRPRVLLGREKDSRARIPRNQVVSKRIDGFRRVNRILYFAGYAQGSSKRPTVRNGGDELQVWQMHIAGRSGWLFLRIKRRARFHSQEAVFP